MGDCSRWDRHHILFKELRIKKTQNESAVLLTVPFKWSKLEHERITQIFFESFNVPGIYIAPQPLLALYGCGSVSGIIVDIGHETTGEARFYRCFSMCDNHVDRSMQM